MSEPTPEALCKAKCVPCEGGVPMLERSAAETFLEATPQWTLGEDAKMISRKVGLKHFVEAMKLLNEIAEVAESEGHHPDLHLTGYRNVRIDLTTHAIGGLSENDFIVAAKIDQLLT
ncbi:MAG: 4a-hydroxytetrahydrobiopterin dehydratase [Pirellulaceae bacterium]|nr:4a-hydroxytetrahydrobiopterin dehydratase [Pirellulaceae bacterium]